MVMEIENALKRLLPEIANRLSSFKDTGYSFEEWFNWELFHALDPQKNTVKPKPSYKSFGGAQGDGFGDIAIGENTFIEIGLVHDFTSSKWLGKLESDRSALLALQKPGLKCLQVILLVSRHSEIQKVSDWSTWLERLSFWQERPVFQIQAPLACGGQAIVLAWCVGS